jgi:hypothetical protein
MQLVVEPRTAVPNSRTVFSCILVLFPEWFLGPLSFLSRGYGGCFAGVARPEPATASCLYGPEVKNAQGSKTQMNNPACEFDDVTREVSTQQCRSSVRKQTTVILILLTAFAGFLQNMSVLYLYLRCLQNM